MQRLEWQCHTKSVSGALYKAILYYGQSAGKEMANSAVFNFRRNASSDWISLTEVGREFQARDAAAGWDERQWSTFWENYEFSQRADWVEFNCAPPDTIYVISEVGFMNVWGLSSRLLFIFRFSYVKGILVVFCCFYMTFFRFHIILFILLIT